MAGSENTSDWHSWNAATFVRSSSMITSTDRPVLARSSHCLSTIQALP